MSLAEFLSSHSVDIRQSELLLLQLMEAVVHLGNYNVSCRFHMQIFHSEYLPSLGSCTTVYSESPPPASPKIGRVVTEMASGIKVSK